MDAIYARNEALAQKLSDELADRRIFAANVMGAPGAGKTTAISNMAKALNESYNCYVIEGDIESDIDSLRLKREGIEAYQINTGGACHLDSPMIRRAVDEAPASNGFLFIENIGNLVCPAEFMIGEHIKILVSSVCEGDDKPYKYPLAFEKADAIILSKTDLLPYVDFDEERFVKGIRALNEQAPIFRMSKDDGAAGAKEAFEWITQKRKTLFSLL
jgi:hydrogenase nickel incorporation protein HypB